MKSAPYILAGLLLVLGGGVARSDVTSQATIGTGYLEHPVGVTEELDAFYAFQTLSVAALFTGTQDRFKLGYDGQMSQFGNDTQLGSQRHGLGGEWFHSSAGGRQLLSAGIQAAIRRQQEWYELYDQDEAFVYAAFKRYAGSNTLWKGYAGYRVRSYNDLPEESCREPHAQLEVQRFSHARTSLGLRIRYGYKEYYDESASSVWGTSTTPSTSQLAARLSFSMSLSERMGLRAWGEYRWKLSEFPHVIGEDFYDSPVLDRYATEGYDGYVALKTLAPHQWWVETGLALGDHDYGEIIFPTLDGGGTSREDKLLEAHLSLQRTLGQDLGRPRLNILGGWRNQDSTHAGYDYSGIFISSNLSWKF